VRVASWNIAFRGAEAARRQGDLLRKYAPDLMLLQELNPSSSEVLKKAAGADWMVRAIDLRAPKPGDPPALWHGVAIAGRGLPPCRSWLLDKIELSDKILVIETQTEGTPFIAVSYHAPPGVTYGIVKPQQAVAFACWLSKQNGPLLFGADANTPLIDAIDLPIPGRTGIPASGNCTVSLEMIFCSALARSTISMTHCAAGSTFIPTSWSGFGLDTRPGPSPSPTGLGSGRSHRARDGASIPSGSVAIGSCGTSSTSTRRA
jgi:hypothetical protein